jgi:hypothetical protein
MLEVFFNRFLDSDIRQSYRRFVGFHHSLEAGLLDVSYDLA